MGSVNIIHDHSLNRTRSNTNTFNPATLGPPIAIQINATAHRNQISNRGIIHTHKLKATSHKRIGSVNIIHEYNINQTIPYHIPLSDRVSSLSDHSMHIHNPMPITDGNQPNLKTVSNIQTIGSVNVIKDNGTISTCSPKKHINVVSPTTKPMCIVNVMSSSLRPIQISEPILTCHGVHAHTTTSEHTQYVSIRPPEKKTDLNTMTRVSVIHNRQHFTLTDNTTMLPDIVEYDQQPHMTITTNTNGSITRPRSRPTRWDTPITEVHQTNTCSNIRYINIPHTLKRKPNKGKQEDKKQMNQVSNMKLALWNAHSLRNKAETIKEYINEHDLDMVLVTEAWLKEKGDEETLDCLEKNGYKYKHCPRGNIII